MCDDAFFTSDEVRRPTQAPPSPDSLDLTSFEGVFNNGTHELLSPSPPLFPPRVPQAPPQTPLAAQAPLAPLAPAEYPLQHINFSSICEFCHEQIDFFMLKCRRLDCQFRKTERLLNTSAFVFRTLIYEPLLQGRPLEHAVRSWLDKLTVSKLEERLCASNITLQFPLMAFANFLRDYEVGVGQVFCHLCGLRIKSAKKYSCFKLIVIENLASLHENLKNSLNFCPKCHKCPLFVLSSLLEIQSPVS